MNYEEKITLLDEQDFFTLFSRLNAEPRWVTSAGKRAIQLIGLCHSGENHSSLFDPSTLKCNCFSECGGGMLLHTWIKRACNLNNPQDAKDFIEDWIENQDLDLSHRVARINHFEYEERPFDPNIQLEMVPGIDLMILKKLYDRFIYDTDTLQRLVWCHQEGISAEVLQKYQVAFCKATGNIILPHHNLDGDIVGIYERSFKPLRKQVKEDFPEIEYKELLKYPRAKYVPLLRDVEDQTEEKTSWSFPNSLNLYGLHLAAPFIKQRKRAIIFEGGKSVMLAHQYGFEESVATHTFGAHLNHIAMLIQCGAEEIYLAFDKQYETMEGQAWELYERKTRELARRIGSSAQVFRLRDESGVIQFKDAPIDCGECKFKELFENAELLSGKDAIKNKAVVERLNKKSTLWDEHRDLRQKEALNRIELHKEKQSYFKQSDLEWGEKNN